MPPRRVLVVGGGIAGTAAAAAAAELPGVDVLLVERESSLGYHTTGRSAALLFENYGALPTRSLTRVSRRFIEHPPDGSTDHPLLSPRGALTIGVSGAEDALDRAMEEGLGHGTVVERVDVAGVLARCPALRPDVVVGGVWEPDAADIDVAGLHQAFVRILRGRGGRIETGVEVVEGRHDATGWHVVTRGADGEVGRWDGDVVIDAAGAWGDVIAERCGVEPIGLQPRRRTAFMVGGTTDSPAWPLVAEVGNRFYFKPDGEQLLCSLADETPSDPCDARPEELDVALAIDRINEATTLGIRHVRSSWAGLRTFAPDRSMVIGPDHAVPAFVWLVGQGGTGIQTAPAAGRLAAALAVEGTVPDDLVAAGVDAAALAPRR